jgi:CheY-like chemotaxis protein/HD-like signal output (HDOD) protein
MTDFTILLVDDDADFRESIYEILCDEGYEVLQASSSPQALEFASRQKLSLCLLDISMPGVDGVQLLRYFRSRHLFRLLPVIILTAGVRKDVVQDLLKLGIRDVMLKSKFSAVELLERISKRLNSQAVVNRPSSFPTIEDSHVTNLSDSNFSPPPPSGFDSDLAMIAPVRADRPKTDSDGNDLSSHRLSSDLIASLGGMRAFSSITEALISAASRPGVSLADLESIVKHDPVIAARMVQMANSASFIRGATVTRVEEALRVLGFTNVIHIATTGAILRQEDLQSEVGEDLVAVWKNCLATGILAEMMADKADKPTAFLRGLLHNLPTFFVLQFLGSDWLPWRAHGLVKGWPLREAISSALGTPLEELAGRILDAYRLPAAVATPIVEFHEFFLAAKPREPGSAARLLDVARLLATAIGHPPTLLSDIRCIHQDEVKGIDLARMLSPGTIEEIEILAQSCNVATPVAVLPKIDREVALWRDPRWVAPDPIESVLALTTDCVRVSNLEELSDWKRVRVAIAEPGTLEWERLGQVAPVIALHRGSLRPGPLPFGVEALRMPVPLHQLFHRIQSRPA